MIKHSIIILLAISLVLAAACGGGDAGSEQTAATTTTPAKPNGQKIYKIHCVICHGSKGDMGASGAHDLTQSELTLEERVNVVTNGRNTMTPFKGKLDADQIEAVAQYTLSLRK